MSGAQSTDQNPDAMIGRTIGKYRAVRKIGEGGMGTVYETVHTELGRRAAVKTLHQTALTDGNAADRFFNEAKAISMVSNPCLVTIFEHGLHARPNGGGDEAYIIYGDNPRNCVLIPGACRGKERCNTVTQQCESADCQRNPGLCTVNEFCDMERSLCVPFTFVLGQPDESANVNASYGQSAPQAALLIPNGDGTSKVVVGDTNNHRILIWNTVPQSNTVPSAVLGIPDARTLSGLAPYGGVTETSTSSPWSLTNTNKGLMLGQCLGGQLSHRAAQLHGQHGEPRPADAVRADLVVSRERRRLPGLAVHRRHREPPRAAI